MNILNIAAGKQKPLEIPSEHPFDERLPRYIVNIDTGYFDADDIGDVEKIIKEKRMRLGEIRNFYCCHDIFDFMEKTTIMFDQIVIYRFLEHVSFTQVNYFIYLISTVLKPEGVVDVIVPNYEILAKMIIAEDIKLSRNFEAANILLTTELLNEPSCPHASIWTPQRAKYFWELEGRFAIQKHEIFPTFQFDGRDIYMRFFARRLQ